MYALELLARSERPDTRARTRVTDSRSAAARRIAQQLAAVALAMAAVATFPSAVAAALEVACAGGAVTISADGVSRSEIVMRIARCSGFDVVGAASLGRDSQTVRLDGVPVLHALRKVLAGTSWLVVEDRAAAGVLRIASIRILGASSSRTSRETAAPPLAADDAVAGHDGAVAAAVTDADVVHRTLWQGDDADLAQEGLATRDAAWLVSELVVGAHSDDRERRLRAIRMLDAAPAIDTATLVAALADAVTDEDVAVRTVAITALASRGDDGAAPLRQAFRDADRDVRLMVLQAVSQRSADPMLLQEALDDPDPHVRRLAASALSDGTASGATHRASRGEEFPAKGGRR